MKKVMAFGTFDIFHPGHVSYLKQAKKYGDCLIVVVARDKTVKEIKGRLPFNDEKTRLKKIKTSRIADEVVLGGLRSKLAVIKKYKPDFIALGYDQNSFSGNLSEKLEAQKIESKIVRLRPYKTKIFKSSKLEPFIKSAKNAIL